MRAARLCNLNPDDVGLCWNFIKHLLHSLNHILVSTWSSLSTCSSVCAVTSTPTLSGQKGWSRRAERNERKKKNLQGAECLWWEKRKCDRGNSSSSRQPWKSFWVSYDKDREGKLLEMVAASLSCAACDGWMWQLFSNWDTHTHT